MSASTNGPTASARPAAARATARPLPGRSLVAGLLLGIGTATTVDEVVFHQLLQ